MISVGFIRMQGFAIFQQNGSKVTIFFTSMTYIWYHDIMISCHHDISGLLRMQGFASARDDGWLHATSNKWPTNGYTLYSIQAKKIYMHKTHKQTYNKQKIE